MKKLWIVLTLLAVALFAFAGMAYAEETITLNETKTVNISIPGDVAIYEFTPDEDGLYLFYSIHPEGDPWYALYGYLLDSDMQLITSNAFGGEDSQFRIVRQLTHDKTYYFGAAFYDKENGMTGSFPIRLEKTNHLYAAPKNGLVYTELGQPGIAEVEAYSQYGGLAYQWYDGETAISGATEPTYSFPAVPVETGSKEYRCVVTDSEDRMAEVFIQARINSGLTVYGTGGGMVEYGGDATLTVTATAKYGTDRLSYSWYREYRDEDGQWNSELLEGETEPTYRLSEITQNQEIECRVTDINGEERSYWFYVQLPRRLNASAVGGNDKAVEKGNPLTMSVTAESEYTPISYKWYKVIWHRVYDEWGEWELIPGANSSTYSIDQVFTGGEYVCQIVDGVGNDSNLYFYVDVSSPFSAELEGENGITIQASETPTLNVQVSNNLGDVTYQWFHYINALERYVPIRGATSANYTLSGTAKAGSYYCAVADTETGELRQVWAHVTVLNDFSVEAEGETNVAVAAGGTTELKVNATGKGKLFYRWYISEYNSEYDYYYDKTIIEGANTDTLIITGNKMCAYICEVSDQYGNSQSITFYASIDNGFSVTAEDTEFIVNPGESVTLSATGTYTHGEITYRWTHSGHYNSTVVKESTESSLTIDAVGADNYGSYQLYAYDPYGNSAFYSFYISVNSSLAVTAVGETDRTINPGADVELAVTATCDIGNISYQWYQQPDNTNSGPWSYELMPLETGATLELTNVQKSKRYYCQVTNEYGREQSVYFAIRIENHLTATAVGDTYRIINPGADVELAVNATCDAGSDSISYQWYQQPDDTNGGPWSYELMPSETGATLELTNVQKSKQYYCRITDVFGGEQNVHFQIRIENHLTANAVGETDRTINPGDNVVLAVNATCDTGSDNISYQWYQQPDDTNGGPWSYELMPSETGATLELTNVQKSKYYYCRVADEFDGEQQVYFQVRIENHLTANAVGETDRTINPGDSVVLAVNATCDTGSDSITYQWYQQPDNTSGLWSFELMPSETRATLELTNIQKSKQYHCRVTDEFGEEQYVNFQIKIDSGLTASAEGSNEIWVAERETATLRVTASSTYEVSISYRWETYDNTTNTLITEPVLGNREYICYVTDNYGNTVPVHFHVGVDRTASISDTYITAGESVTVNIAANEVYKNFIFIPEETAYYRFYSKAVDQDTCGDIYNAGYQHQIHDDDNGSDNNFLIEYKFIVGQKYILGARYNNIGDAGSFPVCVEIIEGLWNAYADTYEIRTDYDESATLHVVTEQRNAELTYTWKKLPSGEIIDQASGDTLTIDSVTQYGEYVCTVSDQFDRQRDVGFRVYVNNPGLVIGYGETQNPSVAIGEETTLQIIASGSGSDEVQYQWYKGRIDDVNLLEGETEATLTITHRSDNNEYYCCVATDQYGNPYAFEFWVYTVNGFYANTDYNETQVNAGESTTLYVNAGCRYGDIHYQWYENEISEETMLAGQQNNSLTLENIQSRKTYYCRVQDESGNVEDLSILVKVWKDTQLTARALNDENSFTVEPGTTVPLTVETSCNGGDLSYQWYREVRHYNVGGGYYWESEMIEGATSETYTAGARSENYYCNIIDQYENETSVSFYVNVDNQLTASQENGQDSYYVDPGQTADMTVIASCAHGGLNYEWHRGLRHEDENGGYHWDWEIVAGANEASYTTGGIYYREQYYCIVSDEYGNYQDLCFNVYLDNGLRAIAGNNQNEYYVEPGETVALSVKASYKNGKLSYQWYRHYKHENGDGSYSWMDDSIEGATGTTYTTDEIYNSEQYYCNVSDEYGNNANVWFNVHVDNGLTASAEGSSEIWVTEGERATLSVTASCEHGNISYQWDGYDNTTDTLVTEPVYGETGYTCYVTDEYGNTVDVWFRVRLDQTAELPITPITAGETITVDITEDGTFSYFVFVPEETAYYKFYSEAVNQNMCGRIYNPSMEYLNSSSGGNFLFRQKFNAGQKYILAARCEDTGSTGSFPVGVEIIEGLWNAEAAKTNTIYTDYNESATMRVLTEQRNAVLTYTWRNALSGEITEEADGDTLTIDSVTQYGEYECTVSDQYGNQNTVGFQVYVNNPDLAIDYEGEPNRNIAVGETTTLQINVNGDGSDAVQYQWYGDGIGEIEGETEATLTVTHRNCYQEWYYCEVTDQYGNKYSYWFWLYTINGFYAWTDSSEQQVDAGNEITLYAYAQYNEGDIHYQWYENEISEETMLAGQQNSSLTLENVQQSSTYYCQVSDDYGNVVDLSILVKVSKETGLTVETITDTNQSAVLNDEVEFGVTAKNNYNTQIQYKWIRTGYFDDNHNWVATDEKVGTENTLTVFATREEEYLCEITDGYLSHNIQFRIDHVWDPEPVVDGTDISYEWASREQHLRTTIQHRHLKCIYDSCGATKELPDNMLESITENHTIGEDGICSVCHYWADGSVSYEIGQNNDLIITGYGEITAEGITQNINDSTRRIRIGEGIARVGTGAFAGISHELHIDFLGGKLPYIDQDAFTGSTAVCRYYHEDESWATASQYGGSLMWMYLPAYVEDDTYCCLVYGRDNIPGWEVMYLVYGAWEYTPMNTEQAMETTFRSREIELLQIPETAALRIPYESHWDLVESIHFTGSCATPAGEETYCINLPNGLHQYFILEIQSSALNLTVNTEDIIDSVHVSGSSTLTVNGDVHILTLEKSDSTGSVTILGDVDGVNITEESNIDNIYRGTLNVTGTVRHGSVYGSGKVYVPRIGEIDENGNETDLEIDWSNMIIGEFDDVTQNSPIAENGQILIPGFTANGARYSKDNCWLHYYWWGDSWRLDFQLINEMYGTGTRPEIQNLNQYKEDFSLSDVQWGENTTLWVEDHGINEDTIQIDGQLRSLSVYNSRVQVNSRVRQIDVHDYWNSDSICSDVTINNEVKDLYLEATNGMAFQVRTGENGSVVNGYWRRRVFGLRQFGRIGSNQTIYSDNHINAMSWREGDQTKAIIPAPSEINAAAGLGAGHEPMMEVCDDSMYLDDEERTAINKLLASEAWQDTNTLNKIVSVFSIEIADYTNIDGNLTYNGDITNLNGNAIDIVVNNPAEGNARVVRLHNENGTITAEAVSSATDQDEITVSSDRFSRFVVMSDTVTRQFNVNGQYIWHNGNGINSELPEQGGALSMDSVGYFDIPYEDRIEAAAEPIWNLEWISGPDCFRLEGSEDNAYQRWLIPKDGGINTDLAGEVQYLLSAEYNGITYKGNVTITLDNADMSDAGIGVSIAHFDPDTLTIGEWQDAGRTVMLESGEMYVIRGTAENVEFNREDWSFANNYIACLSELDKYEYRQPDGNYIFQNNDLLWLAGNGSGNETSWLEMREYNSNLRILSPLTVCITTTGWDMSLPAALTDIEPYAFDGIGARSVMIPYGCYRIGEGAFANAENLERIYIPISVNEIGNNAIPEGTIICTPEGSYAWNWAETNNRNHTNQTTGTVGR